MAQKDSDLKVKRLVDLARTSPQKLLPSLKKMCKRGNSDQVPGLMLSLTTGLIEDRRVKKIDWVLTDLFNTVAAICGVQTALNLLSRIEVMLGYRKPSIGIYDHTLHLIGGGQKYGCTLAHALQDEFDITFIANRKVTHQELKDWYDLDLAPCKIKIIQLPFFENQNFREIDPLAVTRRVENPFDLISRESGNYDIFVNNSMLEKVYPLSNVSVVVCHFPERRRSSYFYADKYTYIVHNSLYTAEWIRKKWKIEPTTHIYPPVDFSGSLSLSEKEKIILSVARFEIGGSKQQLEMVKVFEGLIRTFPEELKDWRLVLVGGSTEENPYLEKIKKHLSSGVKKNIELRINIPLSELESYYHKAKIFWHFCGLYQSDPALVEHFGMSIVEAMQNHCVPVVFDGGGQREIVEQGVSGFRFSSRKKLEDRTLELLRDDNLRHKLSQGAYARGMLFTREVFIARIKKLFGQIKDTYFLNKGEE